MGCCGPGSLLIHENFTYIRIEPPTIQDCFAYRYKVHALLAAVDCPRFSGVDDHFRITLTLCHLASILPLQHSSYLTVWPSGLRRWLQAPVRKGVGSNPTAVTFPLNARFFIGNMQESRDAIVCAPTLAMPFQLLPHCII